MAGQPLPAEGSDGLRSDVVHAVPGFFQALGQSMTSGRPFEDADLTGDVPVAIVDTEFVREFLTGQSPIGARIRLRGRTEDQHGPWLEIVGLIGELQNAGSAIPPSATVYLPTAPARMWGPTLAVRVGPEAEAFSAQLRHIARTVAPDIILAEVKLLSDAQSFDVQVFGWVFLGLRVMVGVLIALAGSGTYALMSFTIAEREREIAIRAALGAPRVTLLRTIGRRALVQLGSGAVAGTVATGWLFVRLVEDGWEPAIAPLASALLIGASVVLVIGTLAGLGPMRAGLSISPEVATRAE